MNRIWRLHTGDPVKSNDERTLSRTVQALDKRRVHLMDMRRFQPYVYDEAAVNRYFDAKEQDASRRLFAIMLGDRVIGELQLKQIDHDKKECTLSIHLQNDAVKGKGYGTQAERLAVRIAFDELGMDAINADTVLKNTRSQRVLEKAGFRVARADETYRYYRIER